MFDGSHRLVGFLHDRLVHTRRVRVLVEHLVRLLPKSGRILDVGCGDGLLSKLIAEQLPDAEIRGMDVVARPNAHIRVEQFNGKRLPLPNDSVDAVLLVDVLHHADAPEEFLEEVARVATQAIVIKDHTCEGPRSNAILRAMDWMGNAPHGVSLPYNYLSREEWNAAFARLGLRIEHWHTELNLYGFPVDYVFGRGLHFVCQANKRARNSERQE